MNSVREVLENTSFGENFAKLPDVKLSRELYDSVNNVLERLGGKWNSKNKRHDFYYNPKHGVEIYLNSGHLPEKNPLAFFPTPSKILDDILLDCNINSVLHYSEHKFIETSAGTGAIADYVISNFYSDKATYTFIEIDKIRAGVLQRKFQNYPNVHVINSPFEDFTSESVYDIAIINPPFSVEGNASIWIDHLKGTYDLLNPKGYMACVTPDFFHKSDKKHEEFKKWLFAQGFSYFENEKDAFKESGTKVKTLSFIFDKSANQYKNIDYAGYKDFYTYLVLMYIENDYHSYQEFKKIKNNEILIKIFLSNVVKKIVACGDFLLYDDDVEASVIQELCQI